MDSGPTYEELLKQNMLLKEQLEKREVMESFNDPEIFEELFRKAADMIILTDLRDKTKSGRILLANQSTLIQLEYNLEDLRKRSLKDLLVPGTELKVVEDYIYPDSYMYEGIFRSKSGRRIHTDVYSHEFVQGNAKYAYAIIRDISRRVGILDKLKESEEKYKRLVESLRDQYIFYSHDLKGMITYLSPSIKTVLGYSIDEAQRNFKEFLTDHEMNIQSLKHSELSLKGIVQPPYISELYHRDGSTRFFHNTETPVFDESGKVIGVEGIAHDVTTRIKAEENLKQQEERFRLLVETIEEVFWIQDLTQGKLIYVSPKYETIFGEPTDKLHTNSGSFLKMVHPDDIEAVVKAYKKLDKGKGFNIEYRIISKDGREKWIWSKSHVIRDEKGKIALSIGTAQDTSDMVHARKDINLLAAILENTEDHAVIKDLDLKVIASNPSNTKAAGKKKAEELIGKTDLEIYGDHERVRLYMENDRKALKLKKGENLVSEEEFVFPDGSKIFTLVKKFPVFDEQEKLIAVASISRDITKQKKILKELFESEQKYRLLIENQGEGIGLTDAGDIFTFVNPQAEEIFGVPPGKLTGRKLYDFLDPQGREQIKKETARREKGQRSSYQLEIIRTDGEKRTILVTATPQFENKVFTGTFGVFRDITEWKKTETSILASENILKETNAAKDKFFSIIAHDLRNPFNSILGFSELLRNDFDNYDREEVQTFVKMINDAAKQAHNLLENLLNWSRSQSGRIKINPSGIDMYETSVEVWELLSASAAEKNISLINKISKGTMAYGDPNMISTVMRNLVSNAIKFTRPKGNIVLSAKTGRKFTEISIKDDGIGIPDDHLKKLFRIEQTVSRSGTSNETGTGLGLVLCKEFMNFNKGEISVSTRVNKGTTFTVKLPKWNQD